MPQRQAGGRVRTEVRDTNPPYYGRDGGTPARPLAAAARIVGTVLRWRLVVAGEADFSRRCWSLGGRIARDRPRIKIISRLSVAKGPVVGGAFGPAGRHFGLAVDRSHVEAPALPQVA